MPCSCKSGSRTALQLIDKYQDTPDTYTFDFAPIEPLSWKEGDSSALVVDIPEVGMEDSRKLSLATLPEEHIVRFTTRIRTERSLYKNRLFHLQVGEFVDITYPEGHFELRREGRPALLLSNGVGIAAMRPLIMSFIQDGEGIGKLQQINVDAGGAIYEDEMTEATEQNAGFRSTYLKHRDELYDEVDAAVHDLMFSTGRMPYFYVVGSDAFVIGMQEYLIASGFDGQDIITDLQGCNCGGSKITQMKSNVKVRMDRKINLNRTMAS